MMVTLGCIAAWTYKFGPGALLYIPNHWPQLISAALAWSAFLVRSLPLRASHDSTDPAVLQATFVYYQSYIGTQMLALGGNTPNPFYNASLVFRSPPSLQADFRLHTVVHWARPQPPTRRLRH
jgi:delta14-sterol reductase